VGAITGVILIPLKSCLPLGMSILGRGVTWALFHEEGHLPVFRERFQILGTLHVYDRKTVAKDRKVSAPTRHI